MALGTKDSLLDQGTVGKVQDLMAKKTDVPHEIRVSGRILGVEICFNGFGLTDWDSCMRIRFTGLRCAMIGVAMRTRRLWTRRRSRALSGSRSTCRRLVTWFAKIERVLAHQVVGFSRETSFGIVSHYFYFEVDKLPRYIHSYMASHG